MQLEPAQLEAVKAWLAEGASLSDVQKRLKEQFNIAMLYLDLRMLVLDIGASVKEPPKKVEPTKPAVESSFSETDATISPPTDSLDDDELPDAPRIPITLDRIVQPGALVSGEAIFPGDQKIHWRLDRGGRLAIDQAPPNFAPTQEEALAFQQTLQDTLMKNGYA